ncbi:hypothetical protein IC582_005575 [Cucumis melo]
MNKSASSQRKKCSMISHPAAKDLLNKSFPHYKERPYVFGKGHATGARVEIFAEVGSNDPARYEAFAANAAPDIEFQPLYNQGLVMSPDELMGTRVARVSKDRHVSNGSK